MRKTHFVQHVLRILLITLFMVMGCSEGSHHAPMTGITNSAWKEVGAAGKEDVQWFFRQDGSFVHVNGTNTLHGNWIIEGANKESLILEAESGLGKVARCMLKKDLDGYLTGRWQNHEGVGFINGKMQLEMYEGLPAIP